MEEIKEEEQGHAHDNSPLTDDVAFTCPHPYYRDHYYPASAGFGLPLTIGQGLGHAETYYIQYHVEQGSKLLANLENDENPLRSLIIPRAMRSPLLLDAICSVSAVHLANRLRERGAGCQVAATKYYIRTVRGVQRTIGSAVSSGVALPEESILAISLLCKYEIVRGSVQQWMGHLNALQSIIMSRRGGLASLDSDTADFLRGMIVYCQNMAHVTNGGQHHARSRRCGAAALLAMPAEQTVAPSPARLDIYIGFTEEIIKLIARIARLYSRADDSKSLNREISVMCVSRLEIPRFYY